MDISFYPRNIIPIEINGTVYPNIRVSDLWCILNVENGVLLSPDWDMISITNPTDIEDKKIVGDGYNIEKDKTTGNYKLTKK